MLIFSHFLNFGLKVPKVMLALLSAGNVTLVPQAVVHTVHSAHSGPVARVIMAPCAMEVDCWSEKSVEP